MGSYDPELSPMLLSPGQISIVRQNELQGAIITIGASVVLSGNWHRYGSTVPLSFKASYQAVKGFRAAYTYGNIDSITHEWDIYRDGWVLRPVLKW